MKKSDFVGRMNSRNTVDNKNNPLSLTISILLIASIPLQLLFWSLYHTLHAGGTLSVNQWMGIAGLGAICLVLTAGLVKRRKWAHRVSIILLALMSLTSVIKLMKGLSQPSPGYLLFLATYLSSLVCLLSPSARESFQ